MRQPLVIEVPPQLEAVTHDPFIDESVGDRGPLVIASLSHRDPRSPASLHHASR
jgi:hypothetical protein